MNKKGGIIKLLIILIILVFMLFVFFRFVKAETATAIVNITLASNSTDLLLNVSDSSYDFNSSNFSSFYFQKNFTFSFQVNVTNQTIVTGNLSCTNSTVSAIAVSCNCPSCPSVNYSCSVPSSFELSPLSSDDLKKKIEESSNKVAQDVIFKLEPTDAQLEECRQRADNATIEKSKIAADNIACAASYEKKDEELQLVKGEFKTHQILTWSFIGFIMISVGLYAGVFSRRGFTL